MKQKMRQMKTRQKMDENNVVNEVENNNVEQNETV